MKPLARFTLPDSTQLTVRSPEPPDAPALAALIGGLSPRDRRWRFHGTVNGIVPQRLLRMVDPQVLQAQAGADTSYFLRLCGRVLSTEQEQEVALAMLCAYRWQYIESGIDDSHFRKALDGMLTPEQSHKIKSALTMLLA